MKNNSTKRFLSILLTVLTLISVLSFGASAAATPITAGSSKATATNIPQFGKDYTSSFDKTNDEDWYKFTTTSSPAYYTIYGKNYNMGKWIQFGLYDLNGQKVWQDECYNEAAKSKSIKLRASETYYICVWNNGDAKGNYQITVSRRDDVDANGKENATPISLNTKMVRTMDGEGDWDCFRFTSVSKTAEYKIYCKNYDMNSWLQFALYDINGQKLWQDECYNGVAKNKNIQLEPSDTYYFYVWGGYTGTYEFSVTTDAAVTTKYTVNYNANGGSVSPTSATVTAGSSVTLPTPSARSGYTCLGWSTSSSATSAAYACGASYKPTGNVTLYAVWKADPVTTKYTVTYNGNGGSVSTVSSTVTAGNSVTLPTPRERAGYTCLGWSTSSSATSASYACGASYKPTGNVTLYAVWQKTESPSNPEQPQQPTIINNIVNIVNNVVNYIIAAPSGLLQFFKQLIQMIFGK